MKYPSKIIVLAWNGRENTPEKFAAAIIKMIKVMSFVTPDASKAPATTITVIT